MTQTNAERQKAWRQRQRNGVKVVTGTVTPEGVTTVAPVTRKRPLACANCEALAGEVARLKRQLAERQPAALRTPVTDAVGVALRGGIGRATVAVPTAPDVVRKKAGAGGYHGRFCPCPFCKAERA